MAIMAIKDFFEPAPPPERDAPEPPLGRKLIWFAGLMLLGVTVVAISAYTMRSLLFLE